MAYRLVTCPETAHLELIELDEAPVGILIRACSRFSPPRDLTCPRTCAARFDGRGRDAEALEDATSVEVHGPAEPLP